MNRNNNNYLYCGCSNCEYSPKTYEEYCISQNNPTEYCPDAYSEKSHLCGNYGKKVNND